MNLPKHPAKYSNVLLPTMASLLVGRKRILDLFGGVGKVGLLREHGLGDEPWIATVEIEPEWGAHPAPGVDLRVVGDATALPFADGSFDAVATSPTYGTRFADRHKPRNEAKAWTRRSYTYDLRAETGDPDRELHPNNTGRMQWGAKYRRVHELAWREARRVLQPGGSLVLNVSDHIRAFERQPVTAWHVTVLEDLGFVVVSHRINVTTPRFRHGENREKRVEAESVILFCLPPVPDELRELARGTALRTEADELEREAVRYMREDGMEEYREALRLRERAREALVAAWEAGFKPECLDAFERYLDSPAQVRKLQAPKRYWGVSANFDAEDLLASVAAALEDIWLRTDDSHTAEERLHDLIEPWLRPAPSIEDFARPIDETTEAMLREAEELRDEAS